MYSHRVPQTGVNAKGLWARAQAGPRTFPFLGCGCLLGAPSLAVSLGIPLFIIYPAYPPPPPKSILHGSTSFS